MTTRHDGKVLADRFETVDTGDVVYESAPESGEHPWDPDRERELLPGQCFARLGLRGPVRYTRVWTDPENLA